MRCRHTALGSTPLGVEARIRWFKRRGYRLRRCQDCGRMTVVVAPNGRFVESFTAEFSNRPIRKEYAT